MFIYVGFITSKYTKWYNKTMSTGSINADKYKITQVFGANPAYYKQALGTNGHPGTDTGQRTGQRVYFEEDSVVTGIYPRAGTAGNMVTCRSLRKLPTVGEWRYLHLSKFATAKTGGLKVGQVKKRGSVVGLAGSTGLATGPHLHMDYRPLVPGTNLSLFPYNGFGGRKNPMSRVSKYRR